MARTLSRVSSASRTSRTSRTRLGVAAAVTAVLAVGAPAAYASLDTDTRAPSATGSTSGTTTTAHVARGDAYTETRLLFGTERPDGGPDVTDKQFMKFIDDEVTPSFPDGLTVQDGRGQWRDSNGKIERERSYELILLYPTTQAHKRDALIEDIREDYVKEYAQDSVARLDDRVRVDF
ncbi:hypothetical protein GCM10010277_46280 [Streptomyces longisporoflavus]|uniref:DUF3574 domain-containing protein n=1 Tax=Streptomyces longisporoflavus TaxID=28044 RepID=UPI00167D1E61|nr:DUF3574 domain-containing protein [Streptomyces longisporoflavus]GGV51077.1 hypothetical protein GCM10010277_46280 [Streptomyces longisporoflavus]